MQHKAQDCTELESTIFMLLINIPVSFISYEFEILACYKM